MRLRSETSLNISLLFALQLVTSFGAIGLLSRISPATDQILQENVYSTEAVEEMLATLADPTPDRERFADALSRAEGNITEEAERIPLAVLRAHQDATVAGRSPDREQTIQALRDLSAINRASMQDASQEAQRLGLSGAWAAAMLGVISFLWSVQVFRRLRARIEEPILTIDAVLSASHNGDGHRRCVHLDGPEEVMRIGRNLNTLLDQARCPFPEADIEERRALLTALDQLSGPAFLVHPSRGTLATNQAALEQPQLTPPARSDDKDWQHIPVQGTPLQLWLWRPASA